uniref:glycerophosphodiester phosphodiesterase family protein n=2 Tax=Pseudomonadota TaxID=1224 RepID=UPI0023B81FDF
VSEAHTEGLRVVVWTVNKPDDMARMIELGVDGIISDRPDLLRQVAGEKRIKLPLGTPVQP